MAASELWDAFVSEVRDCAATRTIEYIQPLAKKWTPMGRGKYKCLSPLRTEKTPSFWAYDDGKGWNDYGTGEGGHFLSFVEKYHHLGFKDALNHLADHFGLPNWEARKKSRGAPAADPEELLKLWNMQTVARRIFAAMTEIAHVCHQAMGSRVREHLRDHYGLTDEFIDLEKFGYCPSGLWKLVHEWPLPYTDEELLATGWFIQLGDKRVEAAFCHRITFPYWKDGVCRYAIGREFFGNAPKSAVTVPEWDKGKYKKLPTHDPGKRPYVSPHIQNDILWGEDCLRFARGKTLIITEGVTDACMLAQLGLPVISPVTIRYREQDVVRVIGLLKKSGVAEVIILNDADTTPDGRHPGLEGAKAMAAGLWAAGIKVRIGNLPKPDGAAKTDVNEIGRDAIKTGGEAYAVQVFEDICTAAQSYPEFLVTELNPASPTSVHEQTLLALAQLAVPLSAMQREDLLSQVFTRLPKLPKKAARATFLSAVGQAETTARAEAKAAKKAEVAAEQAQAPRAASNFLPEDITRTKGHVVEDLGFYEREDKQGGVTRLSNFSLIVLKVLLRDGGAPDDLLCRVITYGGDTILEEWAIPSRAWTSKRAFVGALPSVKMHWFGGDEDVQAVKEVLTKNDILDRVPHVRATDVIGRHEMPDKSLRFVLPAGTIGADGKWMEVSDYVFLAEGGGGNLVHRLPKERLDFQSPEVLSLAKEFFESVFKIHEPIAMSVMASWWMASIFRPVLAHHLGAFPLLNVFATPGSGKSSLFSRVFWPAFVGVSRGELLSCTATLFAYTKDLASTNALGLILDEYKPSDMGTKQLEILLRLLRRSYGGETETRGRSDQGVNLYYLTAAVALLGESRIENDQAFAERCVFLGLDGNWIAQNTHVKKAFYELADKPLFTIAPWIQSWSLLADTKSLFAQAQAGASSTLARMQRSEIPERIRNGLIALTFGTLALDAAAAACGAKLPEIDLTILFRRVLSESLEEDDSGTPGMSTRDNFDEFYRDGATMAHLGVISEGKHYASIDGKLCLWVPGIEALRDEWRRGRGLHGVSPGVRALLRIAKEKLARGSSYVTAVGRIASLGAFDDSDESRRVRCVEIDPGAIPAALGADSYPVAKTRSHGGARAGNLIDLFSKIRRDD